MKKDCGQAAMTASVRNVFLLIAALVSAMKKRKLKKITNEMIGMDDKICSCSSIVGDIIIETNERREKKPSLRKITESLRKNKKTQKHSGLKSE